MALKTDLMGLGLPAALANVQGQGARSVTAGAGGSGGFLGSATPIGANDYLVAVTSGTSSVALPSIGGATGALLGDDFMVANVTAVSINVFAPGGVTIIASASAQTGTTGIILTAYTAAILSPVTSTTWVGVKGA